SAGLIANKSQLQYLLGMATRIFSVGRGDSLPRESSQSVAGRHDRYDGQGGQIRMIDARSGRALAVVAAWWGVTAMVPLQAYAAGAAYQVDTAEVSEAGSCKVETWASFASNRDFFGAVSPACSVPFVRPLELSAQFNRSRSDGEWDTQATPKFKVNLISSAT